MLYTESDMTIYAQCGGHIIYMYCDSSMINYSKWYYLSQYWLYISIFKCSPNGRSIESLLNWPSI